MGAGDEVPRFSLLRCNIPSLEERAARKSRGEADGGKRRNELRPSGIHTKAQEGSGSEALGQSK
jgi:hypothetical protein